MIEFIARTVELVGALVTAGGLAYAYGRASLGDRFLANWLQNAWRWIARRPQNANVNAPVALAGVGGLTADVTVVFELDRTASIEDQLERVAEQCREFQSEFVTVRQQLREKDRAIGAVRDHATSVAAQALLDAKAELKRFDEDLDKSSALDLRWAILGVLINSAGVFMGYWA